MLPAISRRSATCQLVVSDRSGAKLVPNVAGPQRTIRTSRHGEGLSVCSVECSCSYWVCSGPGFAISSSRDAIPVPVWVGHLVPGEMTLSKLCRKYRRP